MLDRGRLAQVFTEMRQRRGPHFSQADLAAATGLDAGLISRLERGLRTPTLEVIQRLAPGYGVTASQLVGFILEGMTPAPSPEDPLVVLTRALKTGPWSTALQSAVLAVLQAPALREQEIVARFDAGVEMLVHEAAQLDELLVTKDPPSAQVWLQMRLMALREEMLAGQTTTSLMAPE